MPKDRDQQTPDDVADARRLAATRGSGTGGSGEDVLPGEPGAPVGTISVTGVEFDDGDLLPDRYAHGGDNVSPALTWTGVPAGAKELVILCEDPDAPAGTFVHWVVTGIDPSATGVAEGTVPAGGLEGVNGFGEMGWGGPEPPVGDDAHRYVFTVLASSAALDVGPAPDVDTVRTAMQGSEVGRGQLVALYQR